MTADRMSVELNLAAALALLSSAALGGITPAKARALRLHLGAISAADGITADLRGIATDVLARWESTAPAHATPSMPPLSAPDFLH